ncbi:MAG: excisionase family DNA-binding protein [Actinomycetota bacterium]|nr:excisionase family DNA-binding protein [Actinomycetota bacterium]
MDGCSAEDRERAREILRALGAQPTMIAEDGTVLDLPASIVEALGKLLEAAAEGEPALVVRSTKDVTTEQAAAVLGVSRPTVVRLVQSGKLPARMIGTHRRCAYATFSPTGRLLRGAGQPPSMRWPGRPTRLD